jgi:mannose/fructose/N-acetylgalactosamine-specific phosphotransferase system component IIC
MRDLSAGLCCGILFELLWLRRPPVGGAIAPDVTLSSIATVAVSAGVRSATGADVTPVVFLCFLGLLPVAFVGKKLDEVLRLGLAKIARPAEALLADGRDRAVSVHFIAALGLGFSLAFLALFPVIVCSSFLLSHLFPLIPVPLKRALGFGYYMVPLVGVADLLLERQEKRFMILFVVGFSLALLGGLIVGR